MHALVDATGGVFASICDTAGFNGALGEIARHLKTLRKYFPLSVTPDVTTLSVTVDGQPVAQDPEQGWQYLPAINSIAFLGSFVPDPGATIVITYAVGVRATNPFAVSSSRRGYSRLRAYADRGGLPRGHRSAHRILHLRRRRRLRRG